MMPFEFSQDVEDIATVPEEHRGLYTAGDDGKATLNESARPLVQQYLGQVKNLADERKKTTNLNSESAGRRVALTSFEDLATELGLEGQDTVAVLKTHITELTDKVKGGKDFQRNIDKLQTQHTEALAVAVKGKDDELTSMSRSLQKHMIGEVAISSLAGHKAKSPELVMPHIVTKCKQVKEGEDYVVRVVDSEGDTRFNSAGGAMTVDDLVAGMKTNATFAPAFESEVQSGGGTKPGSMSQKTTRPANEMTANEKIASGLNKGQHSGVSGKRN